MEVFTLITTKLNERIEFISIKPGKSEDGEPVGKLPVTEFKTRAEVNTAYLSEIRKAQQNGNPDEIRNKLVFIIRFKQRKPINNDWKINWRGNDYKIDTITPNYGKKDMIKIAVSKVVK